MSTRPDIQTLNNILQRSEELDNVVVGILEPATYQLIETRDRLSASFAASRVSLEHARSLRTLIREGFHTSAISLMRMQYEALTRSVWLLYAASDAAVEILTTPLTPAAEKAANRLPMLADMLRAIDGKAPPPATQMLVQFKDVGLSALHSFVHSGIHALSRQSEGYPLPLLVQVVQSSNGLVTMGGMMLAILSGNEVIAKRMSGIQPAFKDCLPDLLPAAAS